MGVKPSISFRHLGKAYTIKLLSRPFREGFEAQILIEGVTHRLGELGLGRRELVLRAKKLIDNNLK